MGSTEGLGNGSDPLRRMTATPAPMHHNRSAQMFLAVLACVTALRIAGLAVSQAELFYDEAQYWAWSQAPDFGYFSKPPLLAWLIGATTAVCGDSEFCIRLPAPFLHAAASVFVYLLARRMFAHSAALWSGILYLTMPGVSLSSTLMSTDVPLLALWSAALYALWRHVETPSLGWGLMLGLAVGFGLNAKYAMAFLPACFVLFAVLTPGQRAVLRAPGTLAALGLAVLLLLPNALWVVAHDNVTVRHTVEDAVLYERFPNFRGLGEFIAAQGGIIGPVAFAWFGIFLLGLRGHLRDLRYRFLFFLCMPIFLVFDVQAFIAKANGNWAATAFPALAVLTGAFMVERRAWRSIVASLVIAAICLGALSSYGAFIGRVRIQPLAGELAKLDGWSQLGATISSIAEDEAVATVVTLGRPLSASMAYYMRDNGLALRAYSRGGAPADYFEMTHPWTAQDAGPVLLVMPRGVMPGDIETARVLGEHCFATRVYLFKRHGVCAIVIR